MQKKSVGNGLYRGEDGSFWIRPCVDGGRTWRKLFSTVERDARKESAEIMRAHTLAECGTGRSPFAPAADTVGDVIALYLKKKVRFGAESTRTAAFWERQEYLLRYVKEWWGKTPINAVKVGDCSDYHAWRLKKVGKGDGHRTVDMELSAFSGVLSCAMMDGLIGANPMRGRPRFQSRSSVCHSRDRMPENGDELNNIAEALMSNLGTQSHAWQLLFESMTGCRTVEAIRMRMDAGPGEPGYIEGDRLDLQRAKNGIQPWIIIHPELRELIAAHRVWHGRRSNFWFFGRTGEALRAWQLVTELGKLRKQGIPNVTSHGMRAYFVTKMRRDGHSDSDVAAMIGDRDVGLISEVYGRPRPGEAKLSWRRSDGTAVWDKWTTKCEVLPFPSPQSAVVQG